MKSGNYSFTVGLEDPKYELLVFFDYEKGDPGCMYQSNGDPGWPEEPDAVEITDAAVQETELFGNTVVDIPLEYLNTEKLKELAWAEVEKRKESPP